MSQPKIETLHGIQPSAMIEKSPVDLPDFLQEYHAQGYYTHLDKHAINIRQLDAPYPFQATDSINEYRREHNGEEGLEDRIAHWGIGNPAHNANAVTKRTSIVVDHVESGADVPLIPVHEYLNLLQAFAADRIIPHSMSYSKIGGNPEARDVMKNAYSEGDILGIANNPAKMTLTTGGFERAKIRVADLAVSIAGERNTIVYDASGIKASAEDIEGFLKQIAEEYQDSVVLFITDFEKNDNFSPEIKDRLKTLAAKNNLLVLNKVDSLKTDSIAADAELGEVTISAVTNPIAETTGVIGLFGHQYVIKWIQDRYSAYHGTTATAEQDMYWFLSDTNRRNLMAELTPLKINDLPNEFLRQSAQMLQLAAKYMQDPVANAKSLERFREEAHTNIRDLEDALNFFYSDVTGDFPGMDFVAANGGAREGILLTLQQLRDSGVTTILIPTADWPYKDLEIPGIKIVFIKDVFTPDRINYDLMKQAMDYYGQKKEKFAVNLNSGPPNPNGILTPTEMKYTLMQKAKEYEAWVFDDSTYLHEIFPTSEPVKEVTYAQVANDIGYHKYIVFSAATKDWGMPGIRKVAISSYERTFNEGLRDRRDRDETPHVFGGLYQLAIARRPREALEIMNIIASEIYERYKRFTAILDQVNIRHTNADGGLYVNFWIPVPQLRDDQLKEYFLNIGKKEGVMVTPVKEAMDGFEAWVERDMNNNIVKVCVRAALAEMRKDDLDFSKFENKVRRTIQVLQERSIQTVG